VEIKVLELACSDVTAQNKTWTKINIQVTGAAP
jgi:hypothetical protein